jgi:hypothetical protein
MLPAKPQRTWQDRCCSAGVVVSVIVAVFTVMITVTVIVPHLNGMD